MLAFQVLPKPPAPAFVCAHCQRQTVLFRHAETLLFCLALPSLLRVMPGRGHVQAFLLGLFLMRNFNFFAAFCALEFFTHFFIPAMQRHRLLSDTVLRTYKRVLVINVYCGPPLKRMQSRLFLFMLRFS